MTDKELLHAVNIADAAMMTVVKALYERGDNRATSFTNMQTSFCADIQQELGSTGDAVSCHTVGASVELLETLKLAGKYLVDRGIEHRGTVGRTEVLPAIKAAIAKAEGRATK